MSKTDDLYEYLMEYIAWKEDLNLIYAEIDDYIENNMEISGCMRYSKPFKKIVYKEIPRNKFEFKCTVKGK